MNIVKVLCTLDKAQETFDYLNLNIEYSGDAYLLDLYDEMEPSNDNHMVCILIDTESEKYWMTDTDIFLDEDNMEKIKEIFNDEGLRSLKYKRSLLWKNM